MDRHSTRGEERCHVKTGVGIHRRTQAKKEERKGEKKGKKDELKNGIKFVMIYVLQTQI